MSLFFPYSTIYFSKVKHSHNFRLPIPFKSNIKIELENPSDAKFDGYTEIQYEKLPEFSENFGYLHIDYRQGEAFLPKDKIELCQITTPGNIIAHWYQMESDHPDVKQGEFLCEGNAEFYLDGDLTPTLEYQGMEDFYGLMELFLQNPDPLKGEESSPGDSVRAYFHWVFAESADNIQVRPAFEKQLRRNIKGPACFMGSKFPAECLRPGKGRIKS